MNIDYKKNNIVFHWCYPRFICFTERIVRATAFPTIQLGQHLFSTETFGREQNPERGREGLLKCHG